LVSHDPDRLQLMVRTNVEGVVALTRTYAPAMADRGRGAILIVSSLAGNQPMPNIAAYAATKAAVTAFGEALHEELRPHGVTVTTIAPGGVATEFAGVAQGNADLDPPSPSALMATAEQTAQAGLDAMAVGRRLVVPGLAVKAVAMAGRYLPRTLWLRISGRLVPTN
jgi:short-subunit dehydrogenase